MDKPPIIDTPENWTAASKGYAEKIAPNFTETYTEEFADRLGVEAHHEVLEVAAGSGAMTQALAKRTKSLLATDFSPGMLEILGERMRKAGASHVTCKRMDGQALEIDDNRYDRAACCFGLMLFPNRAKGFAELHRVLKPGGRAMVSAWTGPDRFEAFGLYMMAMLTTFPDLPPPPGPPPVFSLADLDRFKGEMEAAGFKNIEVGHVSRTHEFQKVDDLWDMMTSGAPPIRLFMDRIGPDGQKKLRGTLEGMVKDRFGDDPIQLTNVATVGCGEK